VGYGQSSVQFRGVILKMGHFACNKYINMSKMRIGNRVINVRIENKLGHRIPVKGLVVKRYVDGA